MLSALTEEERDRWRPLIAPEQVYRFCANATHGACNWLVPADGPDAFCSACRHNRTIPDLGAPEHLLRWQRLEAKLRFIHGLTHPTVAWRRLASSTAPTAWCSGPQL